MMLRSCVLLALLVVAHGAVAKTEEKGNPVQKVIGLLERMQSKIEEEGKTEAAAYDKFACFCKDQADDKLYAITKGNEKIARLTAAIEHLEAEIAETASAISQAKTDIENVETQMENEQAQR